MSNQHFATRLQNLSWLEKAVPTPYESCCWVAIFWVFQFRRDGSVIFSVPQSREKFRSECTVLSCDGAVIVEETCKRHGLKVNCTLLFDIDDTLVLTSRIKSKGSGGRRIDMNPQYLLGRIQEYMFVEKVCRNAMFSTDQFHATLLFLRAFPINPISGISQPLPQLSRISCS